jgi:uncharacterized membrane protein affecting hemolysin expression
MVCQKPNDGDHAHAHLKLAFIKLFIEHSDIIPFVAILCRSNLPNQVRVRNAEQIPELAHAIVYQVNESIASLFARCSMEETNLEEVAN